MRKIRDAMQGNSFKLIFRAHKVTRLRGASEKLKLSLLVMSPLEDIM